MNTVVYQDAELSVYDETMREFNLTNFQVISSEEKIKSILSHNACIGLAKCQIGIAMQGQKSGD